MVTVDCRKHDNWLTLVLEGLRHVGFAIIEGVLTPALLEATRTAMYRVREKVLSDVGSERLGRAGELGVLRLMLKYDPHFFRFLEIPEVLAILDQTVSATAIMHLQNGFILPSLPKAETPSIFQNRFHMDFRAC